MTRRRRFLAALAGLIVAGQAFAPSVAAADDFTLPFWNPSTALNYGVDRDPRAGYQLDWTGQLWTDSVPHYGRVYDNHKGLDYGMSVQTPVAAARNGIVVSYQEGYGTYQYGPYGNFVRLRHADGRDTVYYHLAQNGALVSLGQSVVAGQHIAYSGCSGLCTGPHLHFELVSSYGASLDPMSGRMWTTWPGRVAYVAAYHAESNGSTVAIQRLTTITHWVEFRNTGGRTWSRDTAGSQMLLGTWNPGWRSSAFRAADWPSSWIPTYLDAAFVPPDGIGRFTFGLRAPSTTGHYNEAFNLQLQSILWFDHARLGGYYIPLYVYSGQQP